LTAGGSAAQTCLGIPSADGQVAIAASSQRADGDTDFGAEFNADVTGPAAFGFQYGGLGADGDRATYAARASYDFYLVEPAVCAVAGVLYASDPTVSVESRLGVPIGLGVGKTLHAQRFSATVYAVPQYVWLRDTPVSAGGDADPETSNEFMAETGVTFAFRPLYVGGAFTVTTFDGSEPGFRLRAGFLF
jgi:hypothetical protein